MKRRMAFMAMFLLMLAVMVPAGVVNAAETKPVDISKATVTLEMDTYVYDTKEHTPKVTSVVLDGKTLTVDTDYTVSYKNNITAGTATVFVTGKGNYTGIAQKDFTIEEATLGSVELMDNPKYVYDGSAKKPFVRVWSTDRVLMTENDFSLEYVNNVNAGTATVWASPARNGNCKGGKVKAEFKIEQTVINTEKLSLETETYTYNKTAREPSVTVVDIYGKKLKKDTDYKLRYENNITPTEEAKVLVEPNKNNIQNSATLPLKFRITKAILSSVTLDASTYIYNDGKAITPTVTVKDSTNRILIAGEDYNVSFSNNSAVGTGKVRVTGVETDPYYCTGTIEKEFTIKGALGSVTLDTTSFTYDGKPKTPGVTVKGVDKRTLVEGTDYSVSYSNNTKIGTGTVTITGKGNYSGTLKTTFTIKNATIGTVTLDSTSYVYDGTEKKPAVTVKDTADKTLSNGTDYTLAYTNNKNAGTASVTVTGKGNYSGTKKVDFTIQPAKLGSMTLTPTEYSSFDGTEKKPAVTVKDSKGKELIANTDYTVAYTNNTQCGVATATVTGKGNYTGTLKQDFNIGGKEQTIKVTSTKKTVSAKALKKKARKVSPIKVKNAYGTLKYTKISGSSKLKISASSGKVTVKKKTKKGKYTMKVKVQALGNDQYLPAEKTVKVTIKVSK